MGGTGLEESALTPSKTAISTKRAAESGAGEDKNDPELIKLIEPRPTLPEHVRTKIKDFIEKHSTEDKKDGEQD